MAEPAYDPVKALLQGGVPAGYQDAYRGTFERAYKALTNSPNAPPKVIDAAVVSLASPFIREYQKRTGQMPPEQQVRAFVDENMTQGFAESFVKGDASATGGAIMNQVVRPYLDVSEDVQASSAAGAAAPITPETITGGLRERLDEILGRAEQVGAERIRAQFAPLRERLASEEATLGSRLRSPISSIPREKLAVQEAQSLGELISGLQGQRASGELNLSGLIANIQEQERRAGEAGSRFLKELGLERSKFGEAKRQADIQNELTRLGISTAADVGRRKAEANRPGVLNYLDTAFKGLGSTADLITALKK